MMKQSKLSNHMHWSEAVRSGLLHCDICRKQIRQGYFWDSTRNMCTKCGMEALKP